MRLLRRRLARIAMITTLLASTAAVVAATSPAASAAPAAGKDGWVRIAHLSPQAPAMDMYLYPFGDPGHPVVLKDVSYGAVSAYMAVVPGQYTVAMRGFGAAGHQQARSDHELHGDRGGRLYPGCPRPRPRPADRSAEGPDDRAGGQGRRPGPAGLAQAASGDGQLRPGRSRAAAFLRGGHVVQGRLAGRQTVRFAAPGEHATMPVTSAPLTAFTPSWCLTTPPA